MENFLTWDILLTFSGCVAGTVFLTEWLKKIFNQLPAQFVSFGISVAILISGHIATGTFVWAEVPLYLINAAAVSLSANGGFDILDKAFRKEVQVPADEFVIDGEETYLDLRQDLTEYTDGEVVSFVVRKTESQDSQE